MLYLLVVVAFLFVVPLQAAQPLERYDFDEGGYSLLGLRSEGGANLLADSIGEFYTDDVDLLNELKEEWTFSRPGAKFACGYHYVVFVCRDGRALESFDISLSCAMIVTPDGTFYFDPNKLGRFRDRLKDPSCRRTSFPTLSEAREYLDRVRGDKRLIYAPQPDWATYEGTFQFRYRCAKEEGDCLKNEAALLKKLTEEIAEAYPDEPFELMGHGGSITDLFVQVSCNRSLRDKFKLYPFWGFTPDKWEPYQPTLRTCWSIVPD